MEILVLVLIGLAILWFVYNNMDKRIEEKERQRQSAQAVEKKEDVQQPAETKLDPVAVALDLEPMNLSKSSNPLDVNNDGKVNLEDVKEAVKKTRKRVKKAADVDGDGKVTKADAKAAAKKVKEKATKKVAKMTAKSSRPRSKKA